MSSLEAPFATRATLLAETFPVGCRFSLNEARVRARILQKGIQHQPVPDEPTRDEVSMSLTQRAALRERLARLMPAGRRFSLRQTAAHYATARALVAAEQTRARLAARDKADGPVPAPEPHMAFDRSPPAYAPTFAPVASPRNR